MVETGGLENRFTLTGNGGSNPSPSAILSPTDSKTAKELCPSIPANSLEIPKSTAQRRLPDVQSLGGLPKTTVPRCDRRPSKVSHFDVHRAPAKPVSLTPRHILSSTREPNTWQARAPGHGRDRRGADSIIGPYINHHRTDRPSRGMSSYHAY